VQWAVFTEDPVESYRTALKRMQKSLVATSTSSENQADKAPGNGTLRQAARAKAQMIACWDQVFRSVRGDQVNLLTIHPQGYSSDSDDTTRWIATKTVDSQGMPVCWCERVELQKGAIVDVILTPDKRIDLMGIYARIADGPTKGERGN
jgi:hypothetical protein